MQTSDSNEPGGSTTVVFRRMVTKEFIENQSKDHRQFLVGIIYKLLIKKILARRAENVLPRNKNSSKKLCIRILFNKHSDY